MAFEDTCRTRRKKAAGAAFTKSARYVRVQKTRYSTKTKVKTTTRRDEEDIKPERLRMRPFSVSRSRVALGS